MKYSTNCDTNTSNEQQLVSNEFKNTMKIKYSVMPLNLLTNLNEEQFEFIIQRLFLEEEDKKRKISHLTVSIPNKVG